jgi:heat shock protein HslJ
MNTKSKYLVGLATAAALAVTLTGCGGAASGAQHASDTSATPAASAPADPVTTDAPTDEPTDPATDEPTKAPAYHPSKSDAELSLKQTSKECFGSAGCNVGYKVKVAIDKATLPDSGTLTVYYTVKGGESGPVEDNVDLDLADGTYDSYENSVSTKSKSTKLSVVVTSVEYSEY